jgi:hypothetical protein
LKTIIVDLGCMYSFVDTIRWQWKYRVVYNEDIYSSSGQDNKKNITGDESVWQ